MALTLTITPVTLSAPGTITVSLNDLPGAERQYAITVIGADTEYPSLVTLPIGSASVLFQIKLSAGTQPGELRVTAAQILPSAQGKVMITAPPTSSLPAPSNLAATAASASQINLTWKDNSIGEDGFEMERKSAGSYQRITTRPRAVTTYNDSGLTPGVRYDYRVRAYLGSQFSGYSNEASATTSGIVIPPPPVGPTRYAAPTGSPTGQGTLASPWSLEVALNGKVRPGETLYLLGGTYRKLVNSPVNSWGVRIAGANGNLIHIRPAPGEHPILDGSFGVDAGVHDVWWWDMHFFVSAPHGPDVPNDGYNTRPVGGWHATSTGGTRCKLINCLFESCSAPIGVEQEAFDFEVNGCLFTDCGYKYVSAENSGGHDIYAQNNQTAPKKIIDTIHWKHYGSGYAIHCYGSEAAGLDNIHCLGNIVGPKGGHWQIGGSSPVRNAVVMDNILIGENLTIGQEGSPHSQNVQISNNLLVDAEMRLNNGDVTLIGNTVIFPGGARPATPSYRLRQNVYDPRRANLAVLNWTKQASVAVDPGHFLLSGESYRLMNPALFYGAPVATGTYQGVPIPVPMNGVEFGAFVILKS